MFASKWKILSGIGVDTIGSIISIVVGFIVVPYFFDYISKGQYGLWLTINGLVALISVVDIGTDQYLTTIVADDKVFYSTDIGHHILSTLYIKIAIASIIAASGYIIYLFISEIIVIDSLSLELVKKTYLITLGALVFTLFLGTISTLLYGRQHFSLVSGLAAMSGIVASIGTIFFLALGYSISAFPLALLVAAIIQCVILSYFLLKRYPHIKLTLHNFKFQNKKEMISYSASFQILRWAHTLRTQFVVIAINNWVGPIAAASYNLTYRLPQAVTVFSSKIALPFFPTFSQYFVNGEVEQARIVFLKVNKLLFRFSLFSAIVCLVLTKSFVSLWVGLNSFAGDSVLLILCFYIFVLSAMGSFGIVIYSSKKFEKWTIVSFLEIVFAIILSYALSRDFDLLGIVAGFTLAAMTSQVYLFRIVIRQLQLSLFEFVTKVIMYAIVTNISTMLTALFILLFYEISGWGELMATCLTIALLHVLSREGVLLLMSRESTFKSKLRSVLKL